MKKTLLFLLFIALYCNSFSQSEYRKAYIITNSNDTIHGLIDYRNDELMSKRCNFKSSDASEVITYLPGDIKAFRFENSRYYIFKIYNGEYLFLECLVQGTLNLYYYKSGSNPLYLLENDTVSLISLPYEEGIKSQDGDNYFYKSTKHMGILTLLTRNAPEMQSWIHKIEKPTHESLIPFVTAYNKKFCTVTECIPYKKEIVKRKVKLEFDYSKGLLNFFDGALSTSDFGVKKFSMEAILHIQTKSIGERFYLRTGLIGSVNTILYKDYGINIFHYDLVEIDQLFIASPFQLEYEFPYKKFTPVIAIGPYFIYHELILLSQTTAGVEYNCNEKLSFRFTADMLALPIYTLIPVYPYQFSTNIGLLFKF